MLPYHTTQCQTVWLHKDEIITWKGETQDNLLKTEFECFINFPQVEKVWPKKIFVLNNQLEKNGYHNPIF